MSKLPHTKINVKKAIEERDGEEVRGGKGREEIGLAIEKRI